MRAGRRSRISGQRGISPEAPRPPPRHTVSLMHSVRKSARGVLFLGGSDVEPEENGDEERRCDESIG